MSNASCFWAKPAPTNGQFTDHLAPDEIRSPRPEALLTNGHLEPLVVVVEPSSPPHDEELQVPPCAPCAPCPPWRLPSSPHDEELEEEAQRRARRGLEESKKERQADRKACQNFVRDTFRDRLFLAIRDLEWHAVWHLPRALTDAIPADIAKRRFSLGGAGRERFSPNPVTGGRQMLLQDALAFLKRLRLVDLRETEEHGQEVRATPRQDSRFSVDPELESLLPRSPVEVAQLETRLLAEGCRDALVVWKGHGVLIDGHSRWRLLALLGRPYKVDELDLPDRQAVQDWMWEHHYSRRNYSLEAKSYVPGRLYLALRHQRGGDRRGEKSKSQRATLKNPAGIVADRYQLDRATVYRDAKFAATLDRLVELCGDRVRQGVLAQTLPLTKNDVLRLAKLAPDHQKRIVQEVLDTGNRPQWPNKDHGGKVHLTLPLGHPKAQFKAVLKKLGPAAAWRLAGIMISGLRKRRKPANSNLCLLTPDL